MKIVWKANEHTNHSERRGHKPIAIVNHITGGTAGSAHNWFTSPNNDNSSAHFLVTKDGQIWQYVAIERMAWANGLTLEAIPKAAAAIVKEKNVNPNYYTISIEHEGSDGNLTEAQLNASIWLHKAIREYVFKVYGYEIPFNRKHIIGHYEIDPVRKPKCPGAMFPWSELINRLNYVEEEPKVSVQQWKLDVMKQAEDLGIIVKGSHKPDEPADKAFVVAVVLNALALNKKGCDCCGDSQSVCKTE